MAIIYGFLIVIVTIGYFYIRSYFKIQNDVIGTKIFTYGYIIIMLIIIIGIINDLIPKKMFCADCGQFLGRENNYKVPCGRCGCNIYSYKQNEVGLKTRLR